MAVQTKVKTFDRTKRFQQNWEKGKKSVLYGFGSYCRVVAERSIKKATAKKQTSLPGKPPLSHSGALKNNILYEVDEKGESVVIGVRKLNTDYGDALVMLEHGGDTTRIIKLKLVPAHYPARPFMKPAEKVTIEKKLPALIRKIPEHLRK